MVHITCEAHALHRVCEEIRLQFPKVGQADFKYEIFFF
jgi:hypothetical protein